jgi:hypothetical protein
VSNPRTRGGSDMNRDTSHLRPLGERSKFRSSHALPNHGLRPPVSLVSSHDVPRDSEPTHPVLQLVSRLRR